MCIWKIERKIQLMKPKTPTRYSLIVQFIQLPYIYQSNVILFTKLNKKNLFNEKEGNSLENVC